ncbi:MAG: type II secretion system protein GspD [Candidatus Omnitrophica bacterium]|nr:type II secretion system protein GspD [Candidatus Omnitrophota bacterium]
MRTESHIFISILFTALIGVLFLFVCPFCYSQSATDVRTLLSSEGKVLYGDEPNSLLVIDYPENVKKIEEYLQMIDVSPMQVLIEARVVEVSLEGENSLGINWQAFAEKGGFKMGQFRVGSTANGALEQSLEYKPTFYPPGSTQANDEETPFSLTVFDENINFVVQALANNFDANILSAPRVTTVNNREAVIRIVTELRWVVPEVQNDEGVVTVTWSEAEGSPRDVGISLKVIPMITSDNQISLELEPEISEHISDVELTALASGYTQDYSIPIISTRNAKTKVIIGDKKTLIIGGLIKEQKTKGISKVPILGDIPGLGWFFKSQKDTTAKSELIIFVSPTIVTPEEINSMQKQEKHDIGKWYIEERQSKEEAIKNDERQKIKKDLEKEYQGTQKDIEKYGQADFLEENNNTQTLYSFSDENGSKPKDNRNSGLQKSSGLDIIEQETITQLKKKNTFQE